MRTTLILVLAAFGVYSAYAMFQVGCLGIWRARFANVATVQVLMDLFIASILLLGFLWRDAQASVQILARCLKVFFGVIDRRQLTVGIGHFGRLLAGGLQV